MYSITSAYSYTYSLCTYCSERTWFWLQIHLQFSLVSPLIYRYCHICLRTSGRFRFSIRMKLVALVLLLSSLSSLSLTEVVNSFKQSCPSFFIANPNKQNDVIVPTIFTGRHYKTVCQRWKNEYRFATVYDTEKRIPVYSAYTFMKEVTTERNDEWKIEPQLEIIKEYEGNKEMITSPGEKDKIKNKIINQAVTSDYKGSDYSRGHLFPNLFAGDQDQADSTFTLTNIAPQRQDNNQAWADHVEGPMLDEIIKICKFGDDHQAYVVTGVVPGNKWMSITRDKDYEKGINIPSHYWSAYCCTNKTDMNQLVFGTFIAKMDESYVRPKSINNLQQQLDKLYKGMPMDVFGGIENRVLNTYITEMKKFSVQKLSTDTLNKLLTDLYKEHFSSVFTDIKNWLLNTYTTEMENFNVQKLSIDYLKYRLTDIFNKEILNVFTDIKNLVLNTYTTEMKNFNVQNVSIENLNKRLSELYQKGILHVFGDIKKQVLRAYIAEIDTFDVRRPSIDKLNKRLTELYKKVNFNVFPELIL